jgi:hypothetical protein
MKDEIRNSIERPHELEGLYRTDKKLFKNSFNEIYPEVSNHLIARFWNERLNFESTERASTHSVALKTVFLLVLISAAIAEFPHVLNIDAEKFYLRNITFAMFPSLIFYYLIKNNIDWKRKSMIGLLLFLSAAFINLLPANSNSDTLVLSCLHLPFIGWSLWAYSFSAKQDDLYTQRIRYLILNGDMLIMTTLILICGAILTGITIGLFSLIQIDITEFYFQYIVVIGLASSPIVSVHLIESNTHLVNKISPLIARVFTPIVLLTLSVYLGAIIINRNDPYNDRDFLLLFNAVLIGVMALIVFSVSEITHRLTGKIHLMQLFALSVIAIVINLTALSAIVFRISEWGITPNRFAVLGSNLLILCHLAFVTMSLFRAISKKENQPHLIPSISSFLPMYAMWSFCVVFIFPLLFHFR